MAAQHQGGAVNVIVLEGATYAVQLVASQVVQSTWFADKEAFGDADKDFLFGFGDDDG